MIKDAVTTGSSVVEHAYFDAHELELGKWHRSSDTRGGDNPFTSYIMNKKWTLAEEFNNHMLRFQQVTVSSNYYSKPHLDIPGWIDSQ